jgi:2,3-diketo-5-methylthiopentyl-1-phosphate enolase
MRIAGADLVLFPSPYGSVVMPREENMAIKHVLLTNDIEKDYLYLPSGQSSGNNNQLQASFPVPSAGIHPGLVPLILRDFGHNVVVNAGGGIHGHPLGTIAGGQAFHQAIQASLQGISLKAYAEKHPELQAAINAWGCKE